MNTEMNTDNSNYLVKRTEIKNSPFVIVEHENSFFLICGKYRISNEIFTSEKEVHNYLKSNMWNVIATLAGIISEYNINESKQQ